MRCYPYTSVLGHLGTIFFLSAQTSMSLGESSAGFFFFPLIGFLSCLPSKNGVGRHLQSWLMAQEGTYSDLTSTAAARVEDFGCKGNQTFTDKQCKDVSWRVGTLRPLVAAGCHLRGCVSQLRALSKLLSSS